MRGRLWALCACIAMPGPAPAQEAGPAPGEGEGQVVLTGPSGFEATGRFISYDGRYFRIESPGGELTLDGDVVTCAGEACPPEEDWVPLLRLSGERAIGAVLVPALIEAFAARRGLVAQREDEGPDRLAYTLTLSGEEVARFELHLTGSTEGIAALLGKRTDLAMTAREVTARERGLGLTADLGDLTAPENARIVALDALVPVVGRGNAVRALTFDEVEEALSGGIGDWFDLGGDPGPVARRMPSEDDALGQRADALFEARGALRLGGGAEVASAVAADPLAFGITALSALRGTGATVPATAGGCGIALPVTPETVRRGDHPYAFPLQLVGAARRPSDLARAFLDFVLSDAAQPVVRRAGFVDRAARAVPMSEMGLRLASAALSAEDERSLAALQRMLRILAGAERLSPTFRGAPEGSARAREEVHRLVRAIEAGEHDGRELIFAGFSPGGAQGAARSAEAVLRAVRARLSDAAGRRLRMRAVGAEDVMPIICEDDPGAAALSRRVELWRR